jgi:hypothetical protein
MPRKQSALKRRTTLTLPADSRERILDDYRKAFTGFTADELAILDGIILEPVSAGKRR